ncbi:MAG: hypothetical protein PHH98_04740 [Candidatus Gracilibacteria bacterium]|nr:hypothetical protein [Candidatus Gracilibacteria bacterium]
MKKLIIIALLSISLSSCIIGNKEETTPETNSGSDVNIEIMDETGVTFEELKDDVESTGSEVKVEISNNGNTNVSVEKNIENIVETNDETSKENVTEEEILNDIDSLINDIINSAENG